MRTDLSSVSGLFAGMTIRPAAVVLPCFALAVSVLILTVGCPSPSAPNQAGTAAEPDDAEVDQAARPDADEQASPTLTEDDDSAGAAADGDQGDDGSDPPDPGTPRPGLWKGPYNTSAGLAKRIRFLVTADGSTRNVTDIEFSFAMVGPGCFTDVTMSFADRDEILEDGSFTAFLSGADVFGQFVSDTEAEGRATIVGDSGCGSFQYSGTWTAQWSDEDGDGHNDHFDNCPEVANADQDDRDDDGVGDPCDQCPDDPNKSVPGQCGCGQPDTDTDEDTVADCQDNCPAERNSDQEDIDEDGVGDTCDNCVDQANSDQADTDADGFGDACDPALNRGRLAPANPIDGMQGFGNTVAIDGNLAAVSASGSPDTVYIFQHTAGTWSEVGKVSSPHEGWVVHFGSDVATDGETIFVSSPSEDISGVVYIYAWDGTTVSETAQLTPSDTDGPGGASVSFGQSLALSGDTLLVGAPDDSEVGLDVGAAYVFRRTGTNWTQEAKLTPVDGTGVTSFGFAVALDGDLALIGTTNNDTGVTYVFRRNGSAWQQETTLEAAATGTALAIQGDTAMIGACGADALFGTQVGAVYIFQWIGSAWEQSATLTGSRQRDFFGSAVALVGSSAWIGAPGASSTSGVVHLYHRREAEWVEAGKIPAPGADWHSLWGFGDALATDGARILIGAPRHDNESGAAFAYDLVDP